MPEPGGGGKFGHDPFVFDEKGICVLEAKVLDHVDLTWETWKSHSADHAGEDRSYFAEFRENREEIIQTLRNPDTVLKREDRFGVNYVFVRISRLKQKTAGGVILHRTLPLVVIVDRQMSRVKTFYPMKKSPSRGEVIYP